jgi:hypothetical protein
MPLFIISNFLKGRELLFDGDVLLHKNSPLKDF